MDNVWVVTSMHVSHASMLGVFTSLEEVMKAFPTSRWTMTRDKTHATGLPCESYPWYVKADLVELNKRLTFTQG